MSKNITTDKEVKLTQLFNEWDPIGVDPSDGGPQDEYDCFIDPVVKILNQNQGKADLVQFLTTHLHEHVGLSTDSVEIESFAEKVLEWW